MNLKLFTILLLIIGAASVFSQTPAPIIKDKITTNPDDNYKVEDVRGNIKRGTIYLPKPVARSEI